MVVKDRACATLEWQELFPHSRVTHITASYIDHVPIVLNTQVEYNQTQNRRIPRQFEEKWASHHECEDIVQQTWSNISAVGSPMFTLFEKIKRCRMALVD